MSARRGRLAVLVPLLAVGLLATPTTSRSETIEASEPFDGTHSLVGSYLAGRVAKAQNDAAEASEFYRNALIHDPQNELLLEQAFQIEAMRGEWSRAFKLAEDLLGVSKQHRMAQLALALRDFKAGSWKQAESHFKSAGAGPIGELTSAMAAAWVELAQNNTSDAFARLEMPKQAEWAQFFLRYHKALISDIAGKRNDARTAFERVYAQDARTLRTALAYSRHAAHNGDRKRALSIIDEQIEKSQGDGHPLLRSLKAAVQSGKPVNLIVTTPSEGLAEVFYGLGEALISEGATGVGVLYLQMALFIEPEHQFALAALASAYEGNKQFSDAITIYDRIRGTSPLATAVEIRKAFNLNSLDKIDEARATLAKLLEDETKPQSDSNAAPAAAVDTATSIDDDEVLRRGKRGDAVRKLQEALKGLGYDIDQADGRFGDDTRRAVIAFQNKNKLKADGVVGPATFRAIVGGNPAQLDSASLDAASDGRMPLTTSDKLEILDALGNIMRARKLYAEAIPYYDQALALISKPERRHWVYYYARGTSYERLKNWDAAEVDLQKALSLYPDQPLILNYLGYSWIDQGRNLKEGMAHIEKAVALKPDDGYIVDSLGWAHYMQGNFNDAVRYLERAVELKPDDPVLNDHLGDALWRVGREREARYQWDQALSLKPEPEDEVKIRKKLETGLTGADLPAQAVHGTGKQAAKTGESEEK
ncbi:tetratricopeptide repeat protein [Hyphomicrobium sp.]|uniref:tetratricopeptide repeat protein n=1 Tax=Hyphomicrobium sp. TaxID=82 RepID=UPI002E360256|nr:tetratricopeptide repeat protein [Hyphomicrobium sp.]HEX2841988.1 tetratricopeptide repeat protein [Hyphomicrobium sp.]